MKILNGTVLTLTVLVLATGPGSAELSEGRPVELGVKLSIGHYLNDTDWTIRHPYVDSDGGATWESISGGVEQDILTEAILEINKGHLSFGLGYAAHQVRIGIEDVRHHDLNARGILLATRYYLREPAVGRSSFFFGLQGESFSIDSDAADGGFSWGGQIGFRRLYSTRFGMEVRLTGDHFTYHQVEIADQIEKDLRAFKLAAVLGLVIVL